MNPEFYPATGSPNFQPVESRSLSEWPPSIGAVRPAHGLAKAKRKHHEKSDWHIDSGRFGFHRTIRIVL
jgi:hypothetical protein